VKYAFLLAITLAASFPAQAHQARRLYSGWPWSLPAPPSYTNIFGPGRSGVAPSTAIPERAEPAAPRNSSSGSRTGGVKE